MIFMQKPEIVFSTKPKFFLTHGKSVNKKFKFYQHFLLKAAGSDYYFLAQLVLINFFLQNLMTYILREKKYRQHSLKKGLTCQNRQTNLFLFLLTCRFYRTNDF